MVQPLRTKKERSDRTKAAILAAARERFAAYGYDRTTIRAIAGDASIDPSMVIRYYGSKEKLFAAAAEFDLELPDLASLSRDRVGAALVEHFLDRWEEDDTLQALLRVASTNPAAAERLKNVFVRQIVPMVKAVSADPATAPLRAGLIVSQTLGLGLTRYILRLPPVAKMSRGEVVRWVGPTVQRYVTTP